MTTTAPRLTEREVAVRTLDDVVVESACAGPFALKIDTEGFELDVPRGGDGRTLYADCVWVPVDR